MAAPVVSGVAALVWSAYKPLSNVALRQLLSERAVDLGSPGRDDLFGSGRIDAVRAMAQASPRALCGDGVRDRQSEVCDGRSSDGITCDDLGYDGVLGGQPGCNATCTGLSAGTCQCVPGRTPFVSTLTLDENYQLCGGLTAVSYTHLDVYKRQHRDSRRWRLGLPHEPQPFRLGNARSPCCSGRSRVECREVV